MPRAVGPPLCISMELSTYSKYDAGLAASAARQMSCGIRRAFILAEDSKSHPRRAKSAIELTCLLQAARGVADGQGVHAESTKGMCDVRVT